MSALKVENVSKIFPAINKSHAVQALQDISLEVKTNEFVSILGHSGCGKTTLLNLIAGFEEGVLKMRVGEKAALILPSKIAYGVNGNSTIPPYSPLYFEVEIVGVL